MMNEMIFTKLAEVAFNDYLQSVRSSKILNEGVMVLCQLLIEKGFEFNAENSKNTSDLLDAKKDIVAVLVSLAESSLEKTYGNYLHTHGIPTGETPLFSNKEKLLEDYIKNFVVLCSKKMRNELIYDKFNYYLRSISEEYQNIEMNLPDKYNEYIRNTLDPISLYLVSETCNEIGYKLPITTGHLGNQLWEKDGLKDITAVNDVKIKGDDVKMSGLIIDDVKGKNTKMEASNMPGDAKISKIIADEDVNMKLNFEDTPDNAKISDIKAGNDVSMDLKFGNSPAKSDVSNKSKIRKFIVASVFFLAALVTIIMFVLQLI